MLRLLDILHFLCQIFFPRWANRKENSVPTRIEKILFVILLFLASRNGTGTLFSILLHIALLVVLSFIMLPRLGNLSGIDILGGIDMPGNELVSVAMPPDQADSVNDDASPQDVADIETPIPDDEISSESKTDESSDEFDEHPSADDTVIDPERAGALSPLRTIGGFVDGGGFQHRNPTGRQRSVQNGDSSSQGEAAIERGLEWLAAHQQDDGGWSLHFADSCGRCSPSGTSPSNRRTAATSLALLAFLGAGYSHQTESPYRNVVEKGLLFLINDVNGGIDGLAIKQDQLRMYSYGLASIALCEAYAMNREQYPESRLGIAAQNSLRLIETAQDPDYGGWNYRPDQRMREEIRIGGDTSIFAWQLMALKSGKIGGLNVSQSVLYAAQDFLDSVADDGGRRYLYRPDGGWDASLRGIDSPQTCTAIGLLMRMYLGWKPGDLFLDEGIEQLTGWGSIPREGFCNLYYIYYATLALHHYGGEHWEPWNNELQAMLIQSQSQQASCESGSWYFQDGYGDVGGRLFNTALAIMILETPYRIMPLYREIR